MKKSFLIMALALSFFTIIMPSSIIAANTSNGNQGQNVSNSEDGKLQSVVCERIKTKLQAKIKTQNQYQESHMRAYQNMYDRLVKLSTKAKEAGYDTTDLNTHLVEMNQTISELKTQFQAHLAQMASANNGVCDSTLKDFNAKMKESRNQLRSIHQNAVQIRALFNTKIKADIAAIKEQIRTNNELEDNSGTNN